MEYVWQDKKRWCFFGLPWTFTKYSMTEEKFLIDSGFLKKKQEEIRLYRILDLSLSRGLGQRIFGLGTITCNTADKTSPILVIKNIKHAEDVKEQISDLVERERDRKRVSSREFMVGHDMGEEDDDMDYN
ncbi:MAG: PH domain-containing protein [Eubacterium sp.]|nr:PH domain-containing protein [Eubacterium sp.]